MLSYPQQGVALAALISILAAAGCGAQQAA
jgi:hypothetical protein